MRIMLACGAEGLLEYRDVWRRLPCPLAQPSLLAVRPGGMAAVDDGHRQLWCGSEVHTVDSGLEALALWQNHALTLSGDTDSLTLMDLAAGTPQLLAPAGIYPQDFCFVNSSTLAVCGGMDGKVRLMRLPELTLSREFSLPGLPLRVACSGGSLHVLCLNGDGAVQTLLCRVNLPRGSVFQACTLSGLPGAVCPDGRGGVWVGLSERLAHFAREENAPDLLRPGFGLIRHLARMGSHVLVTDPVTGLCSAADGAGHVRTLYAGDVRHAVVTE